jgi:hypothetical protein
MMYVTSKRVTDKFAVRDCVTALADARGRHCPLSKGYEGDRMGFPVQSVYDHTMWRFC